MTPKYVHLERDHNLNEPTRLVPLILEFFNPRTVCDVGCGLGNFLFIFKQHGKSVHGFDGPWVNSALRRKYLTDEEFTEVDMEAQFPPMSKKFDLVICLEVAEHLKESRSDDLVKYLGALSDDIVFSAAIPFQGGDDHVNENWEGYWAGKFEKEGFKKYDIIRHRIWSDTSIQWWYRQNMVVYSRNDLSQFPSVSFENAVTKECYEQKVRMLSNYSGIVLPKADVKEFIVAFLTKMFGKKFYFKIRRQQR
jgi:SAM-dependent methyltransferase